MIYSENILTCMALPLVIAAFIVKGASRRFVVNFLLGMVVCLLGAYVSGFIDIAFDYGTEGTAIFISPVVEEAMKVLPLLFFFLMFEPEDDRLIHAAVGVGAGFASFENVCSMVSSGTENLGFLLIRGLAVGVMHIVSVFALALGLVIARKFKVSGLSTIIGSLSVSMLFHGAYNLLASKPGIYSAVGFGLPIVTALVLVIVYRSLSSEHKRGIFGAD